ncbi:MAG: glycosyltransferase family 2 protein [Planctomycetota bacterium]
MTIAAPLTATAQDGPHVAVVIPAFRAAASIADVIAGIPPFVRTIVVVDDHSPDDTARVVRELGDTRVHLVRHEQNGGVGAATMTGYREAARLGATILVKMDADGQMDPAALPALIAPILRGLADYTKGNRFLHARELRAMPLLRRVGNLGLSFMTKLASGYWRVFDPTNGFTALHATAFAMLDPRRIGTRYFFETSMLLELGLHRAVVRDVAVPARYGDEQSHLSEWRSLAGFPPRQLRGFLRRVWTQHFVRDFGLMAVFLTSGTGALLFGLLFGAGTWIHSARTGHAATTGTVMLSVLPIIVGVQLLLQAMLLDVQSEPQTALHAEARDEARAFEAFRAAGAPERAAMPRRREGQERVG